MSNRLCTIVIALLLTINAGAVAAPDDDSATIARLAAEWFDVATGTGGSSTRREREIEHELEPYLEARLGPNMTDDDIMPLFREVFEQHKPEYVAKLDAWLVQSKADSTTGRLQDLLAALEMYFAENGSYPSAELGLAVLLESEYAYGPMLIDGWGRSFRYRAGDGTYELRSIGVDGIAGNADDVVANENGILTTPAAAPAAGAAAAPLEAGDALTIEVAGTLPNGIVADTLWLGPRRTVAYRAVVADGQFMGFGEERGPTLDEVGAPIFSHLGGTMAYHARRDGVPIIVANDREHPVDESFGAAIAFVGTDEFLVRSRDDDGLFGMFRGERMDLETLGAALTTEDRTAYMAIRHRRADGWYMELYGETYGPFEWVSRPTRVDDDAVWRTWSRDGGTTLYVDHADEITLDWIRQPVTEGDRIGLVVAEGGTPSSLFRHFRDERLDGGDPTQEFNDSTYYVIGPVESEHRFGYVGNPVLSPANDSFAYRARVSEDEWLIVRDDVLGPLFDLVTRPIWDRTGTQLAYVAHAGEQSCLVVDGKKSLMFDEVGRPAAGDRVFLATAQSGDTTMLLNGTTVLGSFDTIRFRAENGTPYAIGKRDDALYVSFGDTPTGPWLHVTEPTISEDGATVLYGVRDDDGWRMVVNGRAGAAFASVSDPTILSDGRVAYVGVRGIETEIYVSEGDYPPAYRGDFHLITGDEIRAVQGVILSVTAGADGAVVYVTQDDLDDDHCRIYVDGALRAEPEFIPDAVALGSGGRLIYDLRSDNHDGHIIVGDVVSPHYDEVYWTVEPTANGAAWCYAFESGDQHGYATPSCTGPTFERTRDLTHSPDGSTIAYAGARGGTLDEHYDYHGGHWYVAIDTWTSPPFDQVSTPEFVGNTVRFAAQRGTKLAYVTVDLAGLSGTTASAGE